MGLAAAFALGGAACWAGIWKACLEGREIRGLGFRHADAASFVILSFLMAVGLSCPSFEGFWEGQKVRSLGAAFAPEVKGLGWAVAAAFALADAASGRPCWAL